MPSLAERAEREHLDRIHAMPCLVCRKLGLTQTSPTEAHHIMRDPATGQKRKMGQRKPDGFATIPLCRDLHHWNSCTVHMSQRVFERLYGNELELLEQTKGLMELYWDEAGA